MDKTLRPDNWPWRTGHKWNTRDGELSEMALYQVYCASTYGKAQMLRALGVSNATDRRFDRAVALLKSKKLILFDRTSREWVRT